MLVSERREHPGIEVGGRKRSRVRALLALLGVFLEQLAYFQQGRGFPRTTAVEWISVTVVHSSKPPPFIEVIVRSLGSA